MTRSPIVAAIYMNKAEDKAAFSEFIKAEKFDKRVVTINCLFLGDNKYKNSVPLNILRGQGIRNCETSHYIILDIDSLPSSDLYERLKNVPFDVMKDLSQAIIVPTFFFANQAEWMNKPFSEAFDALLPSVPALWDDLRKCFNDGRCVNTSRYGKNHLYLPGNFVNDPSDTLLPVQCFVNSIQEPYVMVPHTVSTPLPREKFTTYGTERMTYILELRHNGFKFSILRNAFVFDIPHSFSVDVVTNENSKTILKESTNEFKIFANHLKRFVPDKTVVPACFRVS